MSQQSQTCADGAPGPYQPRTKSEIVRCTMEPLGGQAIRSLHQQQQEFDAAFPPIRTADQNVLIVNWSEIERQFLDLCAPWDQQNGYHLIQEVMRNAPYQSAEQTLRRLFVINNIRTNIDTPEPAWGSGETLPMP